MKVNKEARNNVVSNLQENNQIIQEDATHILYKMEMADTVEEMMKLKQDLIRTYIGYLPVYEQGCYFCVQRKQHQYPPEESLCDNCPYGRLHGICSRGGSDWSKMKNALEEVEKLLRYYYKPEETYKED